jgi:hypothetical protein
MDNFKALKSLCPTANFQLDEDDYDKLIWHSPEINIPTLEEVTQEVTRLQVEYNDKEYQILRAPEYPDLKELADALYWKSKGDATKLEEYYVKCEIIKNKYPKPE